MALSGRKIAAIRTTYESGLVTNKEAAKRHKISIRTVERLARKRDWKRGANYEKVVKKVEEKAEEKFIRVESDRLAEITEQHILHIQVIRDLTNLNLQNLTDAAEEAKNKDAALHKEISENFFAFQKVCKIASETLVNCYKEERAAMGLDKVLGQKIEINNSMSVGVITEEDARIVKTIFDTITIND